MKIFRNKLALALLLSTVVLGIIVPGCAGPAVTPSTPAPITPPPTTPSVTPTTPAPVATPTPPPPTTPTATTPVPSNTYPNSSLLVDWIWLKKHANDPGLVIIDTRSASLYDNGHILNAINLPPALFDETVTFGDTKDSSLLKSADNLTDIFGKNGVSNTSTVVIYAAGVDSNAGRVFWALEYLGQKDVHILDGGYGKWTGDGNPTVIEKTVKPATTFTAAIDDSVVATKAEVKAALGNNQIIIVDSRNAADFVVKRIPGAKNILMGDYLKSDQTVKAYSDLKVFVESKGITAGKTVITNCYVGYRSAQAYFIFRLMGYPVSNYDGSTTEWFADSSLPTEP